MEFRLAAKEKNTIILDTREARDFASGHIPGSINSGLNGSFARWIGPLIPYGEGQVIIVADKGKEKETITRLSRVGYDVVGGYLDGGIAAWRSSGGALASIPNVQACDFFAVSNQTDLQIIDVRCKTEFDQGHLEKCTQPSFN